MKLALTFTGALLLLACSSEIEQYDGDALEVLIKNRWDWEFAEDFCRNAPHGISFSSDKKKMFVNWYDGTSDIVLEVTEYNITKINDAVLSMEMVGEGRQDDRGNLVSWDLIVNSPTEYCWRRSDWVITRCTSSRKVCTSH